jgi:hypothetical protein
MKKQSGFSDARAVVAECRRLGLKLAVAEGGRLIVRGPAGGLPCGLAEALAAHKATIVAVLRGGPAEAPPRSDGEAAPEQSALARGREAPATDAAPGPSTSPRVADVAPSAPRPDDPEAPAVDEAAATFYNGPLPDPMSDDVADLVDRLWLDNYRLRPPFPDGRTISFVCKRCGVGTLYVTQGPDGSAVVDETCSCGPPLWFRNFQHKATWYWPPRTNTEQRCDERCHACSGSDFWLSIYGLRICRTCHPPPCPDLERRPSEKQSDPV